MWSQLRTQNPPRCIVVKTTMGSTFESQYFCLANKNLFEFSFLDD